MEKKAEKLLHFLSAIEPLKSVTRHSWCSGGRHESVPEHTWRMAIMAALVEDEFPELDIKKLIIMCLIHDLGEIDGDVPSFLKTESDDLNEISAFNALTASLPETIRTRFGSLYKEFAECKTPEAKLANALDKLEAVIQHNDADLSSWEDLEYELSLTYGQEETNYHPFLRTVRRLLEKKTLDKIA